MLAYDVLTDPSLGYVDTMPHDPVATIGYNTESRGHSSFNDKKQRPYVPRLSRVSYADIVIDPDIGIVPQKKQQGSPQSTSRSIGTHSRQHGISASVIPGISPFRINKRKNVTSASLMKAAASTSVSLVHAEIDDGGAHEVITFTSPARLSRYARQRNLGKANIYNLCPTIVLTYYKKVS